jgi:3-deoxy-7-phosphoheptulonate synthase
LKSAAEKLSDKLYIIMRVYFEKPRTTVGWKGLISDPWLDGSFDINQGLALARTLLLELSQLGVPAGTEFLDTFVPTYFSDLIAWCAIGARTVESQIHRELASGLPMPVGFKNNMDGNIKAAIDAVKAAQHSHSFLGITQAGMPAMTRTAGNKDCHIILRGSHTASNYADYSIREAADFLKEAQLTPRMMVDCSHGNSMKEYQRQRTVVHALIDQLKKGPRFINGIMLESHLVEGKQKLQAKKALTYGQSITDGCIGWEDTLVLLEELAKAVSSPC